MSMDDNSILEASTLIEDLRKRHEEGLKEAEIMANLVEQLRQAHNLIHEQEAIIDQQDATIERLRLRQRTQ